MIILGSGAHPPKTVDDRSGIGGRSTKVNPGQVPSRVRTSLRPGKEVARMNIRRLAGPLRFTGPMAAIVLLIVLATGCGSSGGPATITFWSWVPGIKAEVELFND